MRNLIASLCQRLQVLRAQSETYVNVLLSKLLGQALTKCSETLLPSRERASIDITPNTRGGTRENQSSPSTFIVDFIFLESQNDLTRECEGSDDVVLNGIVDILLSHIEEGFENSTPRVPESGSYFGLLSSLAPVMLLDSIE